MAKEIIGSFVFRDEGDDCITCKYVNTQSPPFVEAAKRSNIEKTGQPFTGEYDTVWLESNFTGVSHERAVLRISIDTIGNYKVEWVDSTGHILFAGVGMLYQNLLAGGYWNL